MSSDKRGKVAQRAFLSHHIPHSLAHRVAQLAVEFSSRRPTAAARLCPHQSRPSRRKPRRTIVMAMFHQVPTTAMATSHLVLTTAVALSHLVLAAAMATPHQVPPLTGCCHRTISPATVSPTGMITGRGYAPPIMLRHPPPSSWACSIRCMRRSTTTGLGKQLTIGPGQFVEPDSASRCHPFPPSLHRHLSESTRLRLCHRSSLTRAVQRRGTMSWVACFSLKRSAAAAERKSEEEGPGDTGE